MGPFGVLSDIHGNREALGAALDELDHRGVSEILCLGDVVGYNADSDEVIEMLERRGARSIAGNHDLIALGRLGFERCWYGAAHALARTRATLRIGSRAYLSALPAHLQVEPNALLVHGDLGDPQKYLRTLNDVIASAARVRRTCPSVGVCFFGHTHDQGITRVRGAEAQRVGGLGLFEVAGDESDLFYVNPGSIDAQRKRPGERHAELAIWDPARRTVELLSVDYDEATTERRAERGGYRVSTAAKIAHASRRALGSAARVARRELRGLWPLGADR